MKKIKLLALTIIAVLAFSVFGFVGCNKAKNTDIYLITMDKMDDHWVKLNAGAKGIFDKDGAGYSYTWEAPTGKDDKEQLNIINTAVSNGAKVILLAASSGSGSVNTVKAAMDKGVKFIYVDSPSDQKGDNWIQTLATNNTAAGTQAGEKLKEELASKGVTSGKIGILKPDASPTVNQRADGFKQAFSGTAFTFEEKQTDGSASDSQNSANSIINDVVALYGTNEGTTVGIGTAIKNKADTQVIGCGFDVSSTITPLVKDGHLLFTMQQRPDLMGANGMSTAIRVLKGEDLTGLQKEIDTGASIYDKAATGG